MSRKWNRKGKNKANPTGRSEKPTIRRFNMQPHDMLLSAAYRSLSPNARSLLTELMMLENGSNNGSLYLSVRDAADRMGVADPAAASNAFDELQGMGFIEMTKPAHFDVKTAETSRARCWRLTWIGVPKGKSATWDFTKVQPEAGTQAHKRMERGQRAFKRYRKARDAEKMPVLDSHTLALVDQLRDEPAVQDFNTASTENRDVSGNVVVLDSHTYSYATRGSSTNDSNSDGDTGTVISAWWAHDRMAQAAMWSAFVLSSANQLAKAA